MSNVSKFGMRDYIKQITPKMNPLIAEGFSYHRLLGAAEYLDASIRDSCNNSESTGLKYIGYRVLTPEEEIYETFTKNKQKQFDMAVNDMYLIELTFQYGEEEEPRKFLQYIPFAEIGNCMRINDKSHTLMPVLSDKVISIGDQDIFINIYKAKHNFSRIPYAVKKDGVLRNATVITGKIYRNASKLGPDITKAQHTVMHYLLAYHGYEKTMEMILGFVPTPVYDAEPKADTVIYESTGAQPNGWVMNTADIAFGVSVEGDESEVEGKLRRSEQVRDSRYRPNNVKFIVPADRDNQNVLFTLVNVLYILDNFPLRVSIGELNNTSIWRRFLGEMIYGNEKTLAYVLNHTDYHLESNSETFNPPVINNLRDIGITATSLKELLLDVFINFNTWISTGNELSLTDSKSLEVESFILSSLTSSYNKLLMDINKEEMRNNNELLDEKTVTVQFKKNLRMGSAFGIRKLTMHVAKFEDTTDHLIFKQTAFLSMQERDQVNQKGPTTNTSNRMKLTAEMAIVGSLLNLSKKNPTPLVRINPYMQVDFNNGNIIVPDHLKEILKRTNVMLSQPFVGALPTDDGELDNIDDMDENGDYEEWSGEEETFDEDE